MVRLFSRSVVWTVVAGKEFWYTLMVEVNSADFHSLQYVGDYILT